MWFQGKNSTVDSYEALRQKSIDANRQKIYTPLKPKPQPIPESTLDSIGNILHEGDYVECIRKFNNLFSGFSEDRYYGTVAYVEGIWILLDKDSYYVLQNFDYVKLVNKKT